MCFTALNGSLIKVMLMTSDPYLKASMDLTEASLSCWPAPSRGHRPFLGCSHTLPAASQSYNRL